MVICCERAALWSSAGKELPYGHLLGKSCLMVICCDRAALWSSAVKELPYGHLL